MLHIATVHYGTARWIEIQTRYLHQYVPVPFQTWTSLEGIDPAYGRHFDHVVQQRGLHAAKLNHLAMEIGAAADSPDDLLMFLDGDAFPIADPMALIGAGLATAPLLAVRRAENADEPQPHPSFCVTTVGTWRSLPGDWSAGPTWTGPRGTPISDVGANLMRRLELSGTAWVPVLRSNRVDLDPLYFGVYGDAIYHHGAGFRAGELSPVHRSGAPAPLTAGRGVPGPVARVLGAVRWRHWERAATRARVRQSEAMYAKIASGRQEWLRELI